jgi:NAD(P)-dependent dehydrogenase (short-subunit alcohol dehydrogenase family)
LRFEGAVAIVTGAARGIGRATAERLASEGAEVLAVDREPFEAASPRISPFAADLASDSGPAHVMVAARGRLGRLDILVNNAGIGGSSALETSDDEQIDRILGTNLRAAMRLTREALGLMSRPGGRMVNIASTFGEIGFPRTAAYAAAKGGLAELTRQLVADLAPQGIRVSSVSPGAVLTPMTERLVRSRLVRTVRPGGSGSRSVAPGRILQARMSFTYSIAWVLFGIFLMTGIVDGLATLTIPGAGQRSNEAVRTTVVISLGFVALVASIEALS